MNIFIVYEKNNRPKGLFFWPDNRHICSNKCVIIIKFSMYVISWSKERFIVGRIYYQHLITALRVSLTVDISVQRLNINVVPGIL